MPRFFLSSYTIRLVNRRTGELLPLDSFDQGTDFLQSFDQYLSYLHGRYSHDPSSQKLLRVVQLTRGDRSIGGITETGEYGYESNLYDLESEVISHHRTVHEAEMLPFYVVLHVPEQSDAGILLLQRFGQFGIRKVLFYDFDNYFQQYHPGIDVLVHPLVPEQLLTQYLDAGRITKIRFIRFSVPSDIADAYDSNGHVEEGGYVEYVVSAKRNGRLPLVGRIREFLDGRRDVGSLVELRDFEYDNVKVEVTIGGSRRTLDLLHLARLRPYYDISSEVEIGSNGHPTFESIDGVARALVADLVMSMGIPRSDDR